MLGMILIRWILRHSAYHINATRDTSKLSQIWLQIKYNNFEISLVVFMPNMTTDHAITFTNTIRTFTRQYKKQNELNSRNTAPLNYFKLQLVWLSLIS